MLRVKRNTALILISAVTILLPALLAYSGDDGRTIEIIADKNARFKVPGQKKAVVTVKANELLHLHVIAEKGTEWAKDGAVHSLTINSLRRQGWDLRLKEGVNDFTVQAPAQPGEYLIECTIRCGNGHDDMRMKLVVTP